MTLNQSALPELTQMLRTADGGDLMRQMLGLMLQALVNAEATSVMGAEPHQRTAERTTHRNGTRAKTVSTTSGDLTVKIPRLRQGSFFPTLLEPRCRVDVALHAVVMEAYVHGVSTRKVDDLVVALGVDTGISKSEVSRICVGLDEHPVHRVGRELQPAVRIELLDRAHQAGDPACDQVVALQALSPEPLSDRVDESHVCSSIASAASLASPVSWEKPPGSRVHRRVERAA